MTDFTIADPMNAFSKAQMIGNRSQDAQMQGMQIAQAQNDFARKQQMNQLYQQTGGDPVAMQKALTDSGDMEGAMQFGKMNGGAQKAQQDAEAAQLDMHLKRLDANGRVMSGVKDDATWQAAKPYLIQIWGKDVVQHMPEKYDPALVEQNIRMGQSQKDQLAAQREDRMAQFQQQQLEQGNRRLGILESRSSGDNKPVSWQTVQTADGFAQVNPQTGEVRPVVMGNQGVFGKQVQPKPVAVQPKSFTEAQTNAALFGARAAAAHDELSALGNSYSPIATSALSSAQEIPGIGAISNAMSRPETQKAVNAQRNFITAILRKESGAAISPSEFAEAKKVYFPSTGDSAEVIAQKANNRETAIKGLGIASGGAKYDAPQQGGLSSEASSFFGGQ